MTETRQYARFLSRAALGRKDSGAPGRVNPRADNVPLSYGYPYPDSFAIEDLARATRASLEEEGRQTLQYGGGPSNEQLRQFLMERAVKRGVRGEGNDLLLTAGSMQGLDVAGRTFLNPGDLIMTEAPTFFAALRVFQSWGAQVVGFPLDRGGMIVEALADQLARWRQDGKAIPKLLYIITNFQNPAGVSLELGRRRTLLGLAREYDFLILEDDAYGELRFEGQDVPSLKALDEDRRVIQTGTFSKIVAPGVRVGWAIGPRALTDEMSRSNAGGGLSTFVTGVLHAFCRDGDLDRRVAELRKGYRVRRDTMLASLETHMPSQANWTTPEGGFFVWLEVPAEIDLGKLAPLARESGVTYVEGTSFYTDGRGQNQARLCFSHCDPEALDRGVRTLAGLIRRELAIR